MATKFKVGDVVRSKVDAQCMKVGGLYRVVDVDFVARGIFGEFVTYVVTPVGSNQRIDVGNGHLVLEAAAKDCSLLEVARSDARCDDTGATCPRHGEVRS